MDDARVQTRTLLFADMEGSTRLLAQLGADYPQVLGAYRQALRAATAANDGVEESTQGDGFFATFPAAGQGVRAAVDAQVGLTRMCTPAGTRVRARMGLHLGEVERDADGLTGMAVHEAARIMAAAHGGQIVVSAWLRQLVTGNPADPVTFRSLGRHRLKDISDPVELVQVCHPDLPAEFPPPRADRVTASLPVPRTSFVGRTDDVATVSALLSERRLVTVTGVGGVGKTRLAIEVAALAADRFPDGVLFADLAQVSDPDLVPAAVATAADLLGAADAVDRTLLSHLGSRRALVVLDNCEHLIDAVADLVDAILTDCPSVAVLATSREDLRVDGEGSYRLPSLDAGDADSAAVRLFVERAGASRPGFTLTEDNRHDVVTICQRLDGIPLAIELAASRVDRIAVTDIARHLHQRFDLLVGARRRVQRQQTLQATMDWSWTLLSGDERMFLRRLCVFGGPFCADAAEAVTAMTPAIDRLGALADKSLLTVDESEPVTPYRLLETVRLYAQDRLVEAGEAERLRNAHLDWYLTSIGDAHPDRSQQMGWAAVVHAERANIRAALDWAMVQDRPDAFARLALSATLVWTSSPALQDETRRLLRTVADDERLSPSHRADALAMLANASVWCGDWARTRMYAEQSLALDPTDRPYLAVTYWALLRLDEAADVAARQGLHSLSRVYEAWAATAHLLRDTQGTLRHLEQLRSRLDPGEAWGSLFSAGGLAMGYLMQGDATSALTAVSALRDSGWGRGSTWSTAIGAFAHYPDVLEAMALAGAGKTDDARRTLIGPATAAVRDTYPLLTNDCLVALAFITICEGDERAAARLLVLVAADGRTRMQPTVYFVGWLLRQLRQVRDVPGLPAPREYALHSLAVFTGTTEPEPGTEAAVETALREFVSGFTRR